jgi:choline dehydrogenase-like flavoprotein
MESNLSDLSCDVVVIGSGAGGAVIAHRLTEQGMKVILLEAGRFYQPRDFSDNFWKTMKNLFWDMGMQYAPGRPDVPFIQGRAVGGTTVINSAISWDLPKEVYEQWVRDEAFDVSYDDIVAEQKRVREDIHVVLTAQEVLRGNNHVMARGAERLHWQGSPTDRNEKNCQGSGHCLNGCPHGAKLSMDRTYVPWAIDKGLTLKTECEAEKIIIKNRRVTGVRVNKIDPTARVRKLRKTRGQRFVIKAPRVVVAAGVIQTPLLLQRSAIPDPHKLIGSHLMAHPGVSIVGLFDERVNLWDGATQGYQVTHWREQGLKIESLSIGPSLFALRLPGAGKRLNELYEQRAHMALWAVATRAETKGSVKAGRLLSPIRYQFSQADLDRFLLGIQKTGELFFGAGARAVYPGIRGRPSPVRSVEELYAITQEPVRATKIHPVATHLFGTARLSDDPRRGVINANFESHHVKGLFVADASVFPSNTGVNPQIAIMALAGVAAKAVVSAG